MKTILKNSFGKTILCLLVALLSGGTAWANSDDYYSTVRASVIGEGKVYVSKNNTTNSPDYNENSQQQISTNNNQTHNYYLYAQANNGYYFVGWYLENSSGNGNPNSTDSPYHVSVTKPGHGSENIVIQNYYAKFTSITPEFSLSAEDSYLAPQSVEITCETQGATISYRTDPNSAWIPYSGAIILTETTTIYAQAQKTNGGRTYTGTSEATYTISKNAVVFADNISIPYGSPYTLTTGTSDGVDVKTDGTTVTASNSTNTSVATVSGSTITPVAVGSTTITVTAAEGPTYMEGSETVTITVTAPEGLSEGAPSTAETYTIPASGIGTYCSQYPIDLTALPTGVQAYTVKENTGSLIRMKEITDPNIKGGVGVIYKGEPGTMITFSYTNSENDPTENGLLVGTLAPTYLTAGTAYGLKSGVFYPNTDGIINAHRAYVPSEGNAVKALKLEFEEEDPTGIDNLIDNEDLNDDVIYNLAGQRINKMQKGINIINGKKVLIK